MVEYNNSNKEKYWTRFKDSIIYGVIAFIISMIITKYFFKYELEKCLKYSVIVFVSALIIDYIIYVVNNPDLEDNY